MSATAEKIYPNNGKRNKYDMILNKRLKAVRNKRGLSYAKVVSLLKVKGVHTGVSTIQGYEVDENNANHRYPSPNMILTLANLYECSIDYIFGLTDEMERPTLDMFDTIAKNEKTYWKGQEITDGQKALIVEKINEITSL